MKNVCKIATKTIAQEALKMVNPYEVMARIKRGKSTSPIKAAVAVIAGTATDADKRMVEEYFGQAVRNKIC